MNDLQSNDFVPNLDMRNDDRGRSGQRPGGGNSRKGPAMLSPRPLRTLAFWIMMTALHRAGRPLSTGRPSRSRSRSPTPPSPSRWTRANIKKISFRKDMAHGELKTAEALPVGERQATVSLFQVILPFENSEALTGKIKDMNPGVIIVGEGEETNWLQFVFTYLPVLLILAFWLFFIRQMQSGGSTALKFGKSRAKLLLESNPKITFKDVAGADEAKEELQEIIEFLREPEEIPGAGRTDTQGCPAGWPAGHREDPPGQSRCRRGRRAVLFTCPVRTLWRCSSASVPAGFEISSSRAGRTRRASLHRRD